jgi:hypothetical protein
VIICNFPSSMVKMVCFDLRSQRSVTSHCPMTSLLVLFIGLGVPSVSKLASSAFLASAAGTQTQQELVLEKSQVEDEDTSHSLDCCKSLV